MLRLTKFDLATFVSAPYSITDSPYDYYLPYTNNGIVLSSPVNLTGAMDARLTFWATWNIEPFNDYAQVLASTDNGQSWTPLCGKYTVPGTINQDYQKPLYDNYQFDWVQEEIDLHELYERTKSHSLRRNVTLVFIVVSLLVSIAWLALSFREWRVLRARSVELQKE